MSPSKIFTIGLEVPGQKFWTVNLYYYSATPKIYLETIFGKTATAGQTVKKDFTNPIKAFRFLLNKLSEKVSKRGYQIVDKSLSWGEIVKYWPAELKLECSKFRMKFEKTYGTVTPSDPLSPSDLFIEGLETAIGTNSSDKSTIRQIVQRRKKEALITI